VCVCVLECVSVRARAQAVTIQLGNGKLCSPHIMHLRSSKGSHFFGFLPPDTPTASDACNVGESCCPEVLASSSCGGGLAVLNSCMEVPCLTASSDSMKGRGVKYVCPNEL